MADMTPGSEWSGMWDERPRMTVRRAKHTTGPRRSGYRNWIVTDTLDGQKLVFLSFDLAITAADQLARTGSINPLGLIGCERGDH